MILFAYLKSKRIIKPNPGNMVIDILPGYSISYANTFAIIPKGNTLGSLVTVVAQNGNGFDRPPHLDIYEENNKNYTKIYSFIPDIPDSKNFSIEIRSVTPVFAHNFPESNIEGLVLSLSKTGADYWGDYPVFIGYQPSTGFVLKDFYNGNLSERSEIKNFLQNTTDVTIGNQVKTGESVKSILTQGVAYSYPDIILSFYGDNNCHACEHVFVPLKFQVIAK